MFRNAVSLATLCLAATWAPRADAAEKVTFASGTGSISYVTYYVAEEMGYFEDAGIVPEMMLAGSGAKAMAAVASGDVDVVIRAPSEVMKARKKGLDLVIFGALVTEMSASIVLSRDWAAEHGVTEDSDWPVKLAALKDARLAINGPGSITDAVPRYFAAQAGLDPERNMTLVSIPNQGGAMLLALEQGRVDGFVTSPPDTYIAQKELGATIAFNLAAGRVPELANYFYIGLAAGEDFVKTERAVKVAHAFQMALDAINDPSLTDTVRDKVHAAHYANVDPEIFAEVWKNVVIGAPASLEMNDALFAKVLMLEHILSPELGETLDPAVYTNAVAAKAGP